MKTPPTKPYWEMNTDELREATKEFDRELIIDTFRPLTPAQRRQWERMKRGRGRPRVGKGAKVISISIEGDLLARSDRLAKKLRTSRSRLFAAGLERILASMPAATRPVKPRAKNGRKRAA